MGNAAVIPGGTRLADGSLIGVQSVPPTHPVEPGSSWLGSPAIFLPRRQSSGPFDEAVTFRPPARLVACRLAVEFRRVVLPATLGYVLFVVGTLLAFGWPGRCAAVAGPGAAGGYLGPRCWSRGWWRG